MQKGNNGNILALSSVFDSLVFKRFPNKLAQAIGEGHDNNPFEQKIKIKKKIPC